MNKVKTLTKESMLKNINGLSFGDKAYCGPYGTVTCTAMAIRENFRRVGMKNSSGNFRGMTVGYARNTRRFSVSGSSKLHNGGGWTMRGLRKAICG